MLKGLLIEKLDLISNDFGSTFSLYGDSALANILNEEDIPVVEGIIKKHLGSVRTKFTNTNQLKDSQSGRDIWIIELF